jgi:uncharacterized membrane protein
VDLDVVSEIVIDRPLDAVAGFSADPGNAPRWYENIKSVEWKTEPALEIGSRVEFVARFLGRTLRYTYEVPEYAPNVKLVMRTAQGPFPMETTYTWVPHGETSTRMSLRNRGTPTGFSAFAAPFMALAMRRANRNDLRRLKALLESS